MASNSETGHAINVANFEDLISYCTGYGATYNPSKVALQIPNLITLRTTAQGNIQSINANGTNLVNAINARQLAFDPIKPLATRIVNALAATDASDELVKDAQTINRKIQGARKSTATTPDPVPPVPPVPPIPPVPPAPITDPTNPTPVPTPTPTQISVSQQSYDSLLENFNKLIALVASEPTYTPNEVDLQVATLTAQSATLGVTNTNVINATTNLSNARIARNATLYAAKTGLYDIAQEVKKYVKSVFGAASEQYKQVSKIKFTKPRQ
ncbi:MAG: hypothetical protein ACKVTZ_13975 [Bacteroidia bacterium]